MFVLSLGTMNSNRHFIFHFLYRTHRKLSLKEGNFSCKLVNLLHTLLYTQLCKRSFRFAFFIIFWLLPIDTVVSMSLNQYIHIYWLYSVYICIYILYMYLCMNILTVHPDWPRRSCQWSHKPLGRVNSTSKALSAATWGYRAVRALLKIKLSNFPERS